MLYLKSGLIVLNCLTVPAVFGYPIIDNDFSIGQNDSQQYSNSTNGFGIGGALLFSQYFNETEQFDVLNSSSVLDKSVKKNQKPGYAIVEMTNHNNLAYSTDVKFGSENETVSLLVDTGSTDLWVVNVSNCVGDYKQYCDSDGSFDPSKSKTLKNKKKKFSDGYASGGTALNTWVTDSVAIGDMYLKKQDFGVTYGIKDPSNLASAGIFGLNYHFATSQVINKFQKAVGAKVKGFSIYMGKPGDKEKGQLVLGAIDLAKIGGTVYSIGCVNDKQQYKGEYSWRFLSTGIAYDGKNLSTEKASALFDTGTTGILVPTKIFSQITSGLNAKKEDNSWVFSCSASLKDLEFHFDGGLNIKVPLDTLVTKQNNNCYLDSVVDSGNDQYILGGYFLRLAYVFYNLQSKSALVSQVKITDESDIKTFKNNIGFDKKHLSKNIYDVETFKAKF